MNAGTVADNVCKPPTPATFLTILLRNVGHSNSWVSMSAMIFLG